MFIPVMAAKRRKKGESCKKSSTGQKIVAVLASISVLAGAAVAIMVDKGLSIGLMEIAIIGAVVVLALGATFIFLRPRDDEEKRSTPKHEDNRPIE